MSVYKIVTTMSDINYLTNCSVEDNFTISISEYFIDSRTFKNANEVSVVGIGTFTGISIALFIDILLSIEFTKRGPSALKNKLVQICRSETASRTLALATILLVLPLVIVFLLLAVPYKVLCSVIIKRKDKHYVGFLNSFDVFWSLEGDATKSVINVLGVVEADSSHVLANDMKAKLLNIFPNEQTRKIFYRRIEKYGFYYWRRYSFIDINQYVEVVEFPNKDEIGVTDLEDLMTDLQNQSLPYDDEGLFQILITKQRLGNNNKEKGKYGIIFRIHHSVGDGVALIEFLCQTFADEAESFQANMFSSLDQSKRADSPYDILIMMQKLCEMPLCFVNGILRKPDENSLHGPTLLGKNVFKWTKSDENLLIMIKEIKENVGQLNFTDVILTALSSGLRNLYAETLAPVPEDVAVVLPVRFTKSSAVESSLSITNDFSVTILDLPIEGKDNIKEINQRCNTLRKSADPLTNYYFLKLVTSILPKWVLQPLLYSRQATMVFSNMPGPDRLTICGGNALESLVFFVPLKGRTGLGVTALCYGGVLRLAVSADTAIVPNKQDLELVLRGMVDEIRRLHQQSVVK